MKNSTIKSKDLRNGLILLTVSVVIVLVMGSFGAILK